MVRTCPNCGSVVSGSYNGYAKMGALYCDVKCCRAHCDSLPDPETSRGCT